MTARESIPSPLRLAISGPSAIHDATQAARDFAGDARIDGVDLARLAIVIEELVTNLYDHGGLEADDMFEIELSTTDTDISIVITDCAKAFDPGAAPLHRAVPARGGGAGLKLLRDWATHTEYRTSASQNRLAVLLPRSGRRGTARKR